MLHIRCGDDIRPALQAAGLPGDFVRWADPLCQGPLPGHLAGRRWQETRARFIAESYGGTLAQAQAYLDAQDDALAAAPGHDALVLWFEHDLFDQAILVRLLDWLADQPVDPAAVSLICIGDHPEVPAFRGLGQLGPGQLRQLYETVRHPVTAPQTALARRAWAALCAPDPAPLVALAATGTPALPFLGPALFRHLAEFPSLRDGLARTERLALQAVALGEAEPAGIFSAVQDAEPAPWLGDTMFWPHLTRLLAARHPLLRVLEGSAWDTGEPPPRRLRFALTEAGEAVLAGRADAVWLNGIHRWVGGVQLLGDDAAWRWDDSAGRLFPRTPH